MSKKIKKKPSNEIKRIVVISDTHFGSDVGLLPPGVFNHKGLEFHLSPLQQWLWDRWLDATQKWLPTILGDDPWALVINGDITEGSHHGTTELVSGDVDTHQDISEIALAPLAEAATKTFVVEGTDVHTRGFERGIGKALKAQRNPQTHSHCFPQLFLECGGILCSFKHHITTALRPWTESGSYAAALTKEQADAAKYNHRIPRVVVRSHRHITGAWRTTGGLLVCTPPWQAMTRYARKVTQGHVTPVGLIVLDFADADPDGLPRVITKDYIPTPDPVMSLS